MKLSLALLSVALLLGACSQPRVGENAARGGTAGNCVYASKAHREGDMTCQQGTRYRCENGVWNSTFRAC